MQLTDQGNNIKFRELTDEELDKVSGAGWAASGTFPSRSVMNNGIGAPSKLRRPIKGMESVDDDE